MGLHKEYNESQFSDLNFEEEAENFEPIDDLEHKKRVRRMIEDRLEQKRLKKELEDELDSEFEWDDLEN